MSKQHMRWLAAGPIIITATLLLFLVIQPAWKLNSYALQVSRQALAARGQQPASWPLKVIRSTCALDLPLPGEAEPASRLIYLRAILAWTCGDIESAVAYLRRLSRTATDKIEVHGLLALAALAGDHEEEGLRLLSTQPDIALHVLLRFANESARTQNLPQAAHWLDVAWPFVSESHDQDQLLAFYYLACNIYRDTSHQTEALATCDTLTELYPDRAIHWLLSGRAYVAAQRYDEAEVLLKKAVELEPENGMLYFYLGQAYEGQSKFPDAWEAYQRSIQLAPTYGLVRLHVAALEAARGNVSRAIEHLNVARASGDPAVQRQAEIELGKLPTQER